MSRRNVKLSVLVTSLLITLLLVPGISIAGEQPVQNVIFLMTDGTAAAHIAIARWYKGSPLALDEILVGGVRTYSAESLITDSAPAATAFATGYKSNSKFIGILPEETTVPGVPATSDDRKLKPVATVLEGAKLSGKSVGLIATSNIQHASPAGFSAHTPSRDQYTLIAEQQVYENIDVVFSAGKKYLMPKEEGGVRTDGINLVTVLKQNGYNFIETRDQMLSLKSGKVWGLFADDAMQNDIDRKFLAPTEPSLAEMTSKAIELLSQNKKGFFLFVEASKVDWASHVNEPIGVISDLLAYDQAVRVALDFAKKDGHTLILACADHGNAGMAIGSKEIYKFYDRMPFERLIAPLKQAEMTGEGVAQIIGDNRSESAIRLNMMRYYGIDNLTNEEVAKIQKAGQGRDFAAVIGPMLSARSAIGWIYGGHTGEDLFLYAYGPNHPSGLIENTDIAKITAQSLGFNLADVDRKLFIQAEEAFKPSGASVRIDDSDPNNPVLVIEKGLNQAELPLNTNIMRIGKNVYQLPAVTVYIPKNKKAYISEAAVQLASAAGL